MSNIFRILRGCISLQGADYTHGEIQYSGQKRKSLSKIKNCNFSSQNWHLWAKFSFVYGFLPKYASRCQKNVFWGLQALKTHPNYPRTKGFVLKHHQNDSNQLFGKVKILHFFQNFKFEKWEISFSFSAGNESWKFQKLNFAKKSRFSDGKVIFWQTLWVLYSFGCVLLISELRNAFWSILIRF